MRAAVLLLGCGIAWSQTPVSLRGSVTDPSGGAIPSATVRLIRSGTNSERTTTTDQRGSYTFLQVDAGTYRLQVEAAGFEKYEQGDVRLDASAPGTLDVKMKISQVRQAVTVRGQTTGEQCLTASKRLLPDVGRGLRAIRQSKSGNYYVLTTPGAAVAIYSEEGKRIGQIPATLSPDASIVYGADLQLDSTGRVYVADRAANAIKIYSADGAFAGKIPVVAPISVEPLPEGEVEVASLLSKRLVVVYDTRGRELRSFGETSDSSQVTDAKPLRNRGWFYGDSAGNVYFNLVLLSDPTIRKYDRYGYAAYDITLPSTQPVAGNGNSNWDVGFRPEVRVPGEGTIGAADSGSQNGANGSSGDAASGMTARMEGGMPMIGGPGMRGMEGGGGEMAGGGMGDRPGGFHRPGIAGLVGVMQLTRRSDSPYSEFQIDALGVDPANQEVWAAIAGELVHFDKNGNFTEYYCLSTADQGPVKPTSILVESDRILIGIDPFGIFEYARPDKELIDPAAHH
jgi:Carboxypeptidase regulatory-like domain